MDELLMVNNSIDYFLIKTVLKDKEESLYCGFTASMESMHLIDGICHQRHC